MLSYGDDQVVDCETLSGSFSIDRDRRSVDGTREPRRMELQSFDLAIAEYSALSIRDTILRLRDAGLDSIPVGGAEILDDEVRYKIARLKCLTEDWINVHRTAHQIGMRTTATMMFGVGENYENLVNHFQRLYELQEETGGFTAFIPWSFQPQNTALGGRPWD